jgi:hypothetical protein
MHNILVDIGCNGRFVGKPQEIIITIDFTYFHKNRYHRVKIYEDFSDDDSARGSEELCKVCYNIPGFNDLFFEEIYNIYDHDENIDKFKLLPKWLGFNDLQNFKDMFYLLWCKYEEPFVSYNKNIYGEHKLYSGIYDNVENNSIKIQKIDSAKNMNIDGLDVLEINEDKKEVYKSKCDLWLNNLEITFNYEKEIKIFHDIM